jgi:predicted metal-dependent phosphotriesterase family hydrolase
MALVETVRGPVETFRARSVDEAQIDQMLVANPRRLFERQGAY